MKSIDMAKNLRVLLLMVALLSPCLSHADEGMWLLSQLNRSSHKVMKGRGLKLKNRQLYDPSNPSLKDAIVSFGGFCSGVVVSSNGLVLTNHHCGLSSVQSLSSVEHNYLANGFVSHTLKEELPAPELYVRFLLYTQDVTARVLKAVKPKMTYQQRNQAIDSMRNVIAKEVSLKDSTRTGIVDSFYGGSEYNLSVYRDYTDIRLVFAPPSSVGQFGWDTDNWVWPRHTGDFCIFRIYADKNNRPADYSPHNVPYHPKYVAPISLNGYQEGDFCMTIGYPGTTERYLSSYGIEEMMHNERQSMIDVRGVKQDIWKQEMNSSEKIRLMYASKYSESSNYWKNSIGMNKAIQQQGLIQKRHQLEAELLQWMSHHESERANLSLLSRLESNYRKRAAVNRAMAYYAETFLNGPELMQLSLKILNFDFNADTKQVTNGIHEIVEQYKNYDEALDKKVFCAMLKEYQSKVDTAYLPDLYKTIANKYHASVEAYVKDLYSQSQITSISGLQRFLNRDTTYNIMKDPAITLGVDLIVKYLDMSYSIRSASDSIEQEEAALTAAVRRMYSNRHFYPDANSTMRLSYGSICRYSPRDGVSYNYCTTAQGILEKMREHKGDPDFIVKPELVKLLTEQDYGRYADKSGRMNVCFISNNDITGGNSGSAMFNGKGELIGLAFDGNWEAMSSDLEYLPNMQRCIGVDIRYILFLVDKYGKDGSLLNEVSLVR
jgi:hypothetical protein